MNEKPRKLVENLDDLAAVERTVPASDRVVRRVEDIGNPARPAAEELPFERQGAIPEAIKGLLSAVGEGPIEGTRCGGRVFAKWSTGPQRGKPWSAYCSEPLCVQTGECTGPRFVPHLNQYTATEDDPIRIRRPRKLTVDEQVAIARRAAILAIGRDDDRSDREIADHIKLVWRRMLRAIVGQGKGRFSV